MLLKKINIIILIKFYDFVKAIKKLAASGKADVFKQR